MTETTKNPPVDTLYDRGVKVVIWGNPKKEGNGLRYSFQVLRTYKDQNGNWQDTPYLNDTEILRASLLIPIAYRRAAEHRKEQKEQQEQNS